MPTDGKGNFLYITLTDDQGIEVAYEIYFRTWKPGRGRIHLHVESAYVRDPLTTPAPGVGASRPKQVQQIAFMTVLHNTLNSKQIHT